MSTHPPAGRPATRPTVESALAVIPADDRDLWVRVGMALKSILGDGGQDVWLAWSATSDKFEPRAAMTAWRSFHPASIGPGTLWHVAREHGWRDDNRAAQVMRRNMAAERRAAEQRRHETAQQAAARARAVLARATAAPHPYLARKGFPEHAGLTLDGLLLVPMVAWPRRQAVVGYQAVQTDGQKKFQPPGMTAAQAVHLLGGDPFRPGSRRWWCEGYATALSVHAALQLLYRRQDVVVVAFSAGGIRRMAPHAPGVIIADHDRPDARGQQAGTAAAAATGQPYWAPPAVGTDANDFHLAHGLPALAEALRTFL